MEKQKNMNSYAQINIMIVFAVKYRNGMILPSFREHLHSTIATILNDHGRGSKAICVGGTADHVHVFCSLSPNITLADLVREVKSRSSRWINDHQLTGCHFEWQRGYGAFSYSQSARADVVRYVKNQEEHHRYKTFREELDEFFEKYDIITDPRDLPHEPI